MCHFHKLGILQEITISERLSFTCICDLTVLNLKNAVFWLIGL